MPYDKRNANPLFSTKKDTGSGDKVLDMSSPWKVLIVDDDEGIHQITQLVLDGMTVLGAELTLMHAYTGKEACQVVAENPDIAVILLDVMMETQNAGLDVVDYIRQELANRFVRIILRTGHPGEMFETDVITRYDINDFKEKSELTDQKLKTSLITAIRSYRDLRKITSLSISNEHLEHLVRERTMDLELTNKQLKKEIEERKKSERQIEKESRKLARLQKILDSTLDMIGIFDVDSCNFIYVNKGASVMTGYSRDELLGMEPYCLMPNISKSKFREQFLKPLIKDKTASVTFIATQVRRDGEEVPVEVLLQYVEDQDSSAFVCIIRDVTERNKLDRMKSEFVSTVSHELRTPLTSINGVLKLLSMGALGATSEKAHEMIDVACSNTDRLMRLVDNLLDVERTNSGKLEFRFKPADLVAVVKQAIVNNQAYGDTWQIQYHLVEAPESASVLIDADRISQVLDNLLSNAAKFSHEGGDVDVSILVIDRGYRVEVVDRGVGIPAEFSDRIFEKFTQADGSSTRKIGGTGLGLSISKSIIEKHGGRLNFASTPGVRTCFYFDIEHVDQRKSSLPSREEKKKRDFFSDGL